MESNWLIWIQSNQFLAQRLRSSSPVLRCYYTKLTCRLWEMPGDFRVFLLFKVAGRNQVSAGRRVEIRRNKWRDGTSVGLFYRVSSLSVLVYTPDRRGDEITRIRSWRRWLRRILSLHHFVFFSTLSHLSIFVFSNITVSDDEKELSSFRVFLAGCSAVFNGWLHLISGPGLSFPCWLIV